MTKLKEPEQSPAAEPLDTDTPLVEIDQGLQGYDSVPNPPASAHSADQPNPFRWFILAGLITAAILQVLDTTIVNVALPQMAGNLGATSQEISWVVTGYILSNVIFLPMTAFLTDRFGRKRYLTASIVIFIVSSFFCGTSHTLPEIVFWRILQGAGGAALLSTAQATLVQEFPAKEQSMVQSIFMMSLTVAPTLGPTLGGWITDNYTWNWCFLINVPIGLVAVALVTTFLHDKDKPNALRTADWPGIGLLALGLGTMQYVLEEGQRNDWFQDNLILSLSILSGAALIALVWWQLSPKNTQPVVDFRVLHNRTLAASLFLFIALGFGLYGGTYLFPLLAQTILGFTSMQTGLALLPGGVATAFSIIACGAILGRPKPIVDTRVIIVFGSVLITISMWMLGHLSSDSGQADTTFALLLRGLGTGFLFVPLNAAAFASLEKKDLQQGSGLLSLARQLGGSFGIAALATYVSNQISIHRSDLLTNYTGSNLAFLDRFHLFVGAMMAHGYSLAAAQTAALAIMDRLLMRQAMSMAYNDAFMMVLIVGVITLPAVLLLRKKPPTVAGGHAESIAME